MRLMKDVRYSSIERHDESRVGEEGRLKSKYAEVSCILQRLKGRAPTLRVVRNAAEEPGIQQPLPPKRMILITDMNLAGHRTFEASLELFDPQVDDRVVQQR